MPPKFKRGGSSSGTRHSGSVRPTTQTERDEEDEVSITNAKRFAEVARRAEIDQQMGFPSFVSGGARIGWMINMQPVSIPLT